MTSTVVAYDDASVTIELTDAAETALGTVLIAEGSPLVSFTAQAETTISLTTPLAPASENGVFTTTISGREYGLVGDASVDGSRLNMKDGDTVVFHDPHGHPYATLPVTDFLAAWEAKAVGQPRQAPLDHSTMTAEAD